MSTVVSQRLLLGVTGSIGLVGIHEYIILFRERLAVEIKVIMTKNATRLVSPDLMAVLSGSEVFVDPYDSSSTIRVPHIHLAEWAEIFVVLPASANCLAKVANGICDDLLSTAVLASPRPVAFFPNMNERMYMNPATVRNIASITSYGHLIVPPIGASGFSVGSGERTKMGAMPGPAAVVERLSSWLASGRTDHIPKPD
ncbi:MAG: flavoprotein [Bacillota bacterium]